VLGRGPVRLAVVVEVMVDEVVRGDVRRRRIERAKREDAAKRHVEGAAAEDALMEVVMNDHRVEEAEVASRPEEEDVAAGGHEIHRAEEADVDGDNADLAPFGRILDEPRLSGGGALGDNPARGGGRGGLRRHGICFYHRSFRQNNGAAGSWRRRGMRMPFRGLARTCASRASRPRAIWTDWGVEGGRTDELWRREGLFAGFAVCRARGRAAKMCCGCITTMPVLVGSPNTFSG
jgi:hypothetical protein